MNLLQLQRGSKHFGTKVLFDGASFALQEGEHVGVIGPNGAGKTTLFKILAGQDSLDAGEITQSSTLRLAYLEQEAEWPLDVSVENYLSENCRKPIWELKQLGLELGLTETHFQSPLRSLSGGYRMRVKLLSMIGQEPNLMLLDEPTNFLDLESVIALERFLQNYEGAFLLISHDREFLRRTTESTLEVEGGDITKFPGHIDDYFEQKTELRQQLEAQAANLEAKRKHLQAFVDRFRAKATKAKQAQSRMKQLDKMENIEIKDLPIRSHIKIPAPSHTGREILKLVDAELGYPGKTVLKNVQLSLDRGVHLGVVGHNGAGKSTLLKSLSATLPLLKGQHKLGYQVSLALYSQHSTEQLNVNDSVIEALQSAAHPDCLAQDILNMAGSLLFSGDDIHKKIRVLSGGEKSRVALGQILLKRAPLLLLDEPTNHLDFETVEALTESLRAYEGTVIVVSHDRSFIGRVATQVLEIKNQRLDLYPGTYDDYVWSLQKGSWGTDAAASEATKSKMTGPAQESIKFNYRDRIKEINGRIKESNRKIVKVEELIHAQSQKREQLTADLLSAQGAQAATLAKDLSQCSSEIERLEEDLLMHLEALVAAEKDLQTVQDS